MAFLIELPANLVAKANTVCDEIYLLHSPINFTRQIVDKESNPFEMFDNHDYAPIFLSQFRILKERHYCIKSHFGNIYTLN